MPFTGSHPAAVLPFVRTGLVPSALVIGSMIPDLPYFAPIPIGQGTTHSAVGAVTIDVALGMLVFCLWQGLLAPAAIAAAPPGVRARLDPTLPVGIRAHLWPAKPFALVAASVALGALTHVVWDSFTHRTGWGTARVGWLMDEQGPLSGYLWTQYIGGVIGLLVMVGWIMRWYRHTPPTQNRPETVRVPWWVWGALVAALLVGAVAGAVRPLIAPGGPDWREAPFHAAAGAGSAVGLVAFLLAVGWAVQQRRR